MIEIVGERIMSFSDAAALLPRRRGGKRPHVATLYRWATRGVRGVTLETIRVGGSLCTSEEALQRFCDRLTAESSGNDGVSSSSRRARNEAAERQLDRLGLGANRVAFSKGGKNE